MKFSRDGFLLNTRNIKHPVDISQNLAGIKKYAAGWLIGYRYKNIINDAIDSPPIIMNKFLVPFFVCFPNPENQINKGKVM